MALASLIVGIAATLFALLAWLTARERQPFHLSEKRDGIAKLTRVRRPTVQIIEVFVFGMAGLVTRDRAATVEFRYLARDQSLILDVEKIPPGELVSVRYRTVRPWEFPNISGLPLWAHKLISKTRTAQKIDQQREKLRENTKVWKYWSGHLL